jgi:hypothetical protein
MKSKANQTKSKRLLYFLLLEAAVLLLVLIFTPTLHTWNYLIQSNSRAIHQLERSFTTIFIPNTGQEVLPINVLQILSLLRTDNLASYQLSKQLGQDGTILQRITEAAWPIRTDRKSPNVFCLLEEIKNYPDCDLIDQREAVALVYCH